MFVVEINTNEEGLYFCPNCYKTYKYKTSVYTHLRNDCGKAPRYACKPCNFTCKFHHVLSRHFKTANHKKKQNAYSFSALNDKQPVIKIEIKDEPVEPNPILKHLLENRKPPAQPASVTTQTAPSTGCSKCDAEIACTLKCPFKGCTYIGKKPSYLKLHIRSVRRPKGKGNERCICGKTYYERKNLQRHQKLRCALLGLNPYTDLVELEDASSNFDYLDLHYIELPILRRPKGHGNHRCPCGLEKLYGCDRCGRSYKYLKSLKVHERVKCGKERNQFCPVCGAAFWHKQAVQKHLLHKVCLKKQVL
ncbi:zinc finger protein 27-like [Anthonomus grandis grandis]|uniref:zinc finger protein 27-like n=1 Tax=Anthonomus grandis grandis TaxID=2921223 RepID=UPI002165C360|nr:zinc finger protein 27-like [Anthonomus grandis grandis]